MAGGLIDDGVSVRGLEIRQLLCLEEQQPQACSIAIASFHAQGGVHRHAGQVRPGWRIGRTHHQMGFKWSVPGGIEGRWYEMDTDIQDTPDEGVVA